MSEGRAGGYTLHYVRDQSASVVHADDIISAIHKAVHYHTAENVEVRVLDSKDTLLFVLDRIPKGDTEVGKLLKKKKGIVKKATSVNPILTKPKFIRTKRMVPGYGHMELTGYPDVKIDESMMFKNTYFQVEKSTKKITALATFMPDDLIVGWSNCGGCHEYFSLCTCKTGLKAPRSVEYIYDKTTARLAGQEWDYRHPNYKGSLTKAVREQRAHRSSDRIVRKNITIRRPEDEEAAPLAKKPLTKRTAAPVETPAPKKVLKKTKALKGGEVDFSQLNKEADEVATDALSSISKSLKKPLKKAPEPPRKKLKKK